MPEADDCCTDHRLVVCHLRMTLRKPVRGKVEMAVRRYDCKKLKNPVIAEEYKLRLERHLQTHNTAQQFSVEGEWLLLRQLIADTKQETLEYVTIKHRDWFDDQDQEISQLVEHKRKTRLSYENHPTPERK